MVSWDLSISGYFVNIYYVSTINDTYWDKPQIRVVDGCGSPNLISSGFVLWLILVPAVACVVQLPGSVFLYGRSNFYRLAPEIGVADCLATVCLVLKALWRGYRWKESVAAVFAVREGIGAGDLWWRGMGTTQSSSQDSAEVLGASARVGSSDEHSADSAEAEAVGDIRIQDRLKPYAEPLSLERIIGTSLFILALVKTITLIATASANHAVRLTSMVALAYSFTFIILESLIWTLALITPGYSLEHVPAEDLLELLRYVDPGDNPFTFPSSQVAVRARTPDTNIELGSVHPSAEVSTNPSHSTSENSNPQAYVIWNRAVAVAVVSLGFLGPIMWIFILTNIWKPSRSVFIVTIASLALLLVRLLGKIGARLCFQHTSATLPPWARHLWSKISAVTKKFYEKSQTEMSPFLIRWVWERVTTVNLFSAIWLTVIITYCICIFPLHSLEGLEEPPEKPSWLDWLG